jgi:tight adherence protein C
MGFLSSVLAQPVNPGAARAVVEQIESAFSSPALLVAGLVGIFAGIMALVGTLVLAQGADKTGVARSLAAVEALQSAPKSMRQQELEVPFAQRVLGPAMRGVTGLGRRLTPQDQVGRIRKRLDLAGNPAGWDVDRVVSLKVLLTVVGVTLGLLVCLLLDVDLLRTVAALVVVALIGWFTPSLIVYQMSYNRSEQILKDLPDALDLLTISVEAGLGFDAALSQVARNTEGPLAQEFFRVLQEMQIGTGRMDALRALGERTDVGDLKSFVSAMVQADAYGVPIASVLRVQSDEMRTRRSQRAEEAAQRVPVKILFPLIFGIMPALFVVIIGPAVVEAFISFRDL